ncbi:B87 [Murid betaherpesvirus 8]|uniref:B87 n=9 Tax=Muromegalovirus TaxID=10365 RepID=K7XR28_RCMVE|nr:E87 [Murid betaherpesvirus 8]AKE44254.1 a87 [Rat cytomegalovirus ALL-03]AFX83401.1 E87 [Murid betaherpesvirus 8]AKB93281.1 B87 [Murid betaherpesvirus 8]WEG71874.1 protein UL87 [Murid betaherpesvirus 8]WPH24996.1 B87 [Murid betaherpesvirus 8]
MSVSGASPASMSCVDKALIVKSTAARVKNAPVCVNSHNLTREIAPFEDSRLSQPVSVDEEHISSIFGSLMSACPDASATDEDRARIVLCRLLLGPVAVPCYCDEWDVDEYMAKCAYRCSGPALYVHRARCRCGADGGGTMFTMLYDHYTTHVFRGLLSLAEWNTRLVNVFCDCNKYRSDRYVMAVLPKHYSIVLDYYPYFLVCLARYLTVPDIDDCVNSMTVHLGPQIAARVGTHYKILFGANARAINSPLAGRSNYDMFLLELQKLWLSISYRNEITRDFFEAVFSAFHYETGKVMLILRTPMRNVLYPRWLSVSRCKKQVLYFELTVRYVKSRKEDVKNAIVYKKNTVIFGNGDVLWRNLFYVYYMWTSRGRRNASEASGPTVSEVGAQNVEQVSNIAAQRYVRIVDRLALVRLRHKERIGISLSDTGNAAPCFDFDPHRCQSRHRAAENSIRGGEGPMHGNRKIIGGREFSEMTAVSLNRVAVNAFNTNRVINLKATVSQRRRLSAFCFPRNMTHSFVMYKHTFKEPPYTVSTFVSNDAAHTSSLNVNIRGSYQEFLYALTVYRLYVNVKNFFLPAAVCNSNSSLDVHGVEDQGVIRSARDKVYWTTNFPCMISNTNDINVGWFKAATAIIPKVSGVALENVLLKELTYVTSIEQLCVDYALHRVFILLETRNCYQIPFLSKQFILFLRVMMLKVCGLESKPVVDRLIFHAIRDGVFDYHKNTVAHTKIKHTCALVGTRLANNVPKVLIRNKKVKLDYLGRNANLLTLCRHIDHACVDAPRLNALLGVLEFLEKLTSAERTREALVRARNRLSGALESEGDRR